MVGQEYEEELWLGDMAWEKRVSRTHHIHTKDAEQEIC